VLQVWFQNRRAKFRRNERSILAQRTQLQQFAAASISRKCATSSPSQLNDDIYHRQLHQHQHYQQQQQQQQYMMESTASPASSMSQTMSTSTTWQGGPLPLSLPLHYVQSAALTSATDLLYSTAAPAAAVQSAGGYNSSTTDNGLFQQQHSVVNDDALQSTAAVVHQRIKELSTAYTTQTTTSF